jgi:hypothetical protein
MMIRKIKKRIGIQFRWMFATIQLWGNDKSAAKRFMRRPMDRSQWRRWYQANKKHQRRLTALKRMGVRIPPNATGLSRYVVP